MEIEVDITDPVQDRRDYRGGNDPTSVRAVQAAARAAARQLADAFRQAAAGPGRERRILDHAGFSRREETMANALPSVFIGSSVEGMPIAEAVQKGLTYAADAEISSTQTSPT
jgi:hypothetical protein